nr:MMPL family transporter [Solirubrobacterales bacterium]
AESAPAKALVQRLRDPDGPLAGLHRRADVAVGGPSAASVDVAELVEGSVWKIALLLIALSYAVLVFVLRSVLLPLKAILLTLVSVAAAYGALVAVFQWGWLEAVGIESFGSVQAISLPLVLAVVFGLSMDYEVFLLSRIRERYDATGDDERAVAEGLQRSAGTITSAAVIMVVVFSAFVLAGLPGVQQLGLGCAIAIALDATLIRLVLVPATMRVLGRWNWWMPRAMRRVWLLRDRPSAQTTATVRP